MTFSIAVAGVLFSSIGIVIGLVGLTLMWVMQRRLNYLALVGILLGVVSLPINAYTAWRLWP